MVKSLSLSTSVMWTCPNTQSWWVRCLTAGAASKLRLTAGRTVCTCTQISSIPSYPPGGNYTKNNPFIPSSFSHSFLLRLWDLEKQEKQLNHYQQSSTSLEQWMDNARKRQDTLQMAKLSDIQTLMDHLNQQKACLSHYLQHFIITDNIWTELIWFWFRNIHYLHFNSNSDNLNCANAFDFAIKIINKAMDGLKEAQTWQSDLRLNQWI